jgi:hypothetical protein
MVPEIGIISFPTELGFDPEPMQKVPPSPSVLSF